MSEISDQAPRGGCVYCGLAVRTRKGGEWRCSTCDRMLRAHEAGRHVLLYAQCPSCVSDRRAFVRSIGL